MKQLAVFIIALTLGFTGVMGSATAQMRLNVLVMGDDGDLDTVARNNRIFNRVLAAPEDRLHFGGYDTWNERAITGTNFVQDRVTRSEIELIEIARLVQTPPIDVLVSFSIYPNATQTRTTTLISARITGKMLSMPDGRHLGGFEVDSPDNWTAPFDCDRDCILEAVGDKARILAQSLGEVLVTMLDDQTRGGPVAVAAGAPVALSRNFNLAFNGFTEDDTRLIEEYLVSFTGYQSHSTIYAAPRVIEWAYKTTDDSAEIVRKLNVMLDRIGVDGWVFCGGNDCSISKSPTQERRRVNVEGL